MKLVVLLLALFVMGCASNGAIGVVYNQRGIIRHVFKGSPAEKAGLQVHDIIFNTSSLRGRIGSMCLVKYKRGSVSYEKLIERVNVDNFKSW